MLPQRSRLYATIIICSLTALSLGFAVQRVMAGEAVLSARLMPAAAPAPKNLSLNLGSADPVIDPALPSWGGSAGLLIDNQLFVGLTKFDDTNIAVIPQLATSWTANSDATQFTFTLRSDVEWSDGSPVTAEDVRYGILRTLNPTTGASMAYVLFPIQNAEDYSNGVITDPNLVGVTVLNPTQIQFDLHSPTGYFPAILTLPPTRPMPESAITAHGSSWTEPGNILTNGAYELTSWVHGTSMTLEKNPDYYAAEDVQIDQADFVMVDDATAWTMYQSGTLHSAIVPDGQWAPSMADPALASQMHRAQRQCTYYYGFNTSKAPFDNVLVRKAFIAAVDRQGLIDDVLQGPELPALTYAPPTTVGHVDGVAEGIGVPYDVTQAQNWLAAAGYPGGAGLPPIVLVYNTDTGHEAIANYVRQEWIDNLGVTVTLADLDFATLLDLLEADPPQIWRLGWCADQPDAWNFIVDGIHPTFFGGWSNPSYSLYRVLASEEDIDATRFGYYENMEEIVVETDAIMFPIYYYSDGMITDRDLLRGYGIGGYGAHIEDWIYRNLDLFLPMILR